MNALPERAEQIAKGAERIAVQLGELTSQLQQTSKAQGRLAIALNVFTFLLVIVGALQVYYR